MYIITQFYYSISGTLFSLEVIDFDIGNNIAATKSSLAATIDVFVASMSPNVI